MTDVQLTAATLCRDLAVASLGLPAPTPEVPS